MYTNILEEGQVKKDLPVPLYGNKHSNDQKKQFIAFLSFSAHTKVKNYLSYQFVSFIQKFLTSEKICYIFKQN